MVGHDLPQVRHLLQQLGEQLHGVRVVDLQVELQGVEHRLLEPLDGPHVQQARPVCREAGRWVDVRTRPAGTLCVKGLTGRGVGLGDIRELEGKSGGQSKTPDLYRLPPDSQFTVGGFGLTVKASATDVQY